MKESILIQLGEQVRTLRHKHELTQEELAVRSQISLKYIQKIEGKNPPDVGFETLGKLSQGFDIPIWKLVKFD